MARPTSEKKLVDAIIDGEVGALEISKRATELGVGKSQQIHRVAQLLTQARAKGRVTVAQASKIFFDVFMAVSLASFAEVGQEMIDHSEKTAQEIGEASRGLDVSKIPAVREPDFMERELEKRGLAEGGGLKNG